MKSIYIFHNASYLCWILRADEKETSTRENRGIRCFVNHRICCIVGHDLTETLILILCYIFPTSNSLRHEETLAQSDSNACYWFPVGVSRNQTGKVRKVSEEASTWACALQMLFHCETAGQTRTGISKRPRRIFKCEQHQPRFKSGFNNHIWCQVLVRL